MKRISLILCGMTLSLFQCFISPATAKSQWINHLDPSYVTELIYRDGFLYATTHGGLVQYDIASAKFRIFDNVAGLVSNNLSSLVFDSNGDLFLGTDDVGIEHVRVTTSGLVVLATFNRLIDGIAGNAIRSVAIWQGDLLYGTDQGAGKVVGNFASQPWDTLDGLPSLVINDVMSAGSKAWIATDSGIVVIDEFEFISMVPGAPASGNVLASDGQRIWVGTDAGVWRYDPLSSSWTDLGLTNRRIRSFAYDGQTMRAGGARFGSSPRVFAHQSGQTWTNFTLGSITAKWILGNAFTDITGLAIAPNGDVYAGAVFTTEFRGFHLAHWDGSTLENLVPSVPAANNIERLSLDLDGSVWASFRNFYVGKLTPDGRWVNYNPTIPQSDSISSRFANLTCLADSRGRKWFCTLTRPSNSLPLDLLVDQLDDDYSNDVWDHFFVGDGGGDGLGSQRLQRAFEDPVGNIWFVSDALDGLSDNWWGIQILKADGTEWLQVNPASTNQALASGDVTYLAFDDVSTYIATRDYGVQRWFTFGHEWANLSSNVVGGTWSDAATLSSSITAANEVNAVAVSSEEKLWIGTDVGVFRQRFGSSFDHFDVYRGIGVGLLSPKVNDITLDHEENLWVATDLGLNRIMKEGFKIEAHSTEAAYQAFLAGLRFSFEDVISDIANARVKSLALHPTKDILYVGTVGGLSVFDYTFVSDSESDLSSVYVYPNPLYGSRGHENLMIENITGPVSVEVYNIEGQLVHSQSADMPGQSIWPLTTSNGFIAASGLYLVRISNNTTSVVKPVAIVR